MRGMSCIIIKMAVLHKANNGSFKGRLSSIPGFIRYKLHSLVYSPVKWR